ncbi:MAG: hypothetical protein NC328_07665 [Muribaculum sp.]|nr:hypothetical protein [Muribaculum sp.]
MMKTLIIAPEGMLRRYLLEEFKADQCISVSLDENTSLPVGTRFDLAVLAPSRDSTVGDHSLPALRSILKSLAAKENLPGSLTLIGSDAVYSPDAGAGIDENTPLNPADAHGEFMAAAEREVKLWSEATGVGCTVLRAAMTFGKDVDGVAAGLFADVIGRRYIHVRGEEGRISVVTAIDLARAVRLTAGTTGVFNVADGSDPTWCRLAEAMSANAGAEKRMATLPAKWADVAWRYAKALPAVRASLSPAVRETRSLTRTLSSEKLQLASGWSPFNTLDVLARTDPDYPYCDK